jgi:hypothetical protein
MKKLIVPIILGLIMFGAAFGGAYYFQNYRASAQEREIKTVTSASLAGLKEQARLTAFMARFVAVVTSKQEKLGLTAERTIIMPGTVRYEIDLKAIRPQDVVWNEEEKTLVVKLPPPIISGPEVDLNGMREYGAGGILSALTDAREVLDEHNRITAQVSLIEQAKSEAPMRLARDASRKAIERAFSMPLRAAGIKAAVEVVFTDEAAKDEGGEGGGGGEHAE